MDRQTKGQRISDLIYQTLSYMYCDNCRYSEEISEKECELIYGESPCEMCHRKYNGWGISMVKCNEITKKILVIIEDQDQ